MPERWGGLFSFPALGDSDGLWHVQTRYTVRMHRSHLKAREDGDFSTWEQAWKIADKDGDGNIVFKEHYNIENEGHHAGPASEIHFHDDGEDFAKMVVDTRGWDEQKQMTHDEFMLALHEYVDSKHSQRKALYDMAHTIF
ncbi:hypothetical protein T484DRAFT_1963948 [Baffinella frigidus]|nr:hypothetical protein T484DRAFT_1963948 [Cryptophyta sp. CCMP2293]